VLVLGVLAVVLLMAGTAVAVTAVGVARARAASAADLAALAAASRVVSGPASACAAARSTARAVGASLTSCRLSGAVVDVVAVVRPGGLLGEIGTATGRARAGPVAPPQRAPPPSLQVGPADWRLEGGSRRIRTAGAGRRPGCLRLSARPWWLRRSPCSVDQGAWSA
jgi:secretion/DNA translocation related TadE-like protein